MIELETCCTLGYEFLCTRFYLCMVDGTCFCFVLFSPPSTCFALESNGLLKKMIIIRFQCINKRSGCRIAQNAFSNSEGESDEGSIPSSLTALFETVGGSLNTHRPAFIHPYRTSNTDNYIHMSVIYLLRHADAEPRKYYDTDHDRELNVDGQRDARRLGQFLAATDQLPNQIISSTAVRARQTAELLPEGGQWMDEVPFRSSHALYQAQPADVLTQIKSVDKRIEAVLLVGHEPTWSTVVSQLLGSANVSLSPGTCARIDLKASWQDVTYGGGILRWMIPPALLR